MHRDTWTVDGLVAKARAKEGLEELVVAAVVAQVRLPDPTDDWQHDAYAIAEAMWRGIRAHPAAIPLVLTRRTLSATGFGVADALIGALERGGLPDHDRLAAFHAVLGFVIGAVQTELAGPLTRGRDAADAADRIGSVAGATYPLVAPTYTPDGAAALLTQQPFSQPTPGPNRYLPAFPYVGTPHDGFNTPSP